MAESSGNQNTRIDRIERALEHMISGHEQMRHEHEFSSRTTSNSWKRVADLVSAIGSLIARIPPSALAH